MSATTVGATTTVEAMYRAVERDAKDWRRPHLGASVLGKDCDRAVWLSFRWVQNPELEGRILALFDRGTAEEKVAFSRLRAAGIRVDAVDPETGKQWHVELGPHVSGSADSIVTGLLEAPDEPHVLDVKTAKLKSYEAMLKSPSARAWSAGYWAQQQVYMHGLRARGIEVAWAALLVVCKDDDRMHMLRFPYEPAEAASLVGRAWRIVEAPEPPLRITNDPTAFGCKHFCDFYETCQLGQHAKLARNCRTCLSSTPRGDGTWYCEHHARALSTDEQKRGCDSHLLVPPLLPREWEPVEADEVGRSVEYLAPGGAGWVDRGGRIQPTNINKEGVGS